MSCATARSGSTTLFSGISAGTELSYVKGTNPYLTHAGTPGLGLFRPGEPHARTR